MGSLVELERDWTIDMIADAHHWLDELEFAQAQAQANAAHAGGG